MNDNLILRVSLDIGFDKDCKREIIKETEREFKQCIKETIVSLLNDNDDILSFNIIGEGLIEGDDGQ